MTKGYLFCVYDRKENFHSCYVAYEDHEGNAKELVAKSLASKELKLTDIRKIKHLNEEKLEVFVHMHRHVHGLEFKNGDCARVGIYV